MNSARDDMSGRMNGRDHLVHDA